MAREPNCGKCKCECLENETTVVCEGFCVGMHRFHARCVGLSDDEGEVCLHRNILWVCESCRDLIENIRFRDTVNSVRSMCSPVEKEVENLKTEVSKMNATIRTLLEKAAIASDDHCGASKPSERSVSQQPLIDDTPPLTSTMIASPLPTCSDTATVKLHISNIAIDVTENEVVQMIAESIGVMEIVSIRCLKPAWRDAATMDFISFRVEIPVCHRKNALNSSKWPKGIRCREFRDISNTSWRPVRC